MAFINFWFGCISKTQGVNASHQTNPLGGVTYPFRSSDLLSPVELCCMLHVLDSLTGLYLTADELFAVRHSTLRNYQFGFYVSMPIP